MEEYVQHIFHTCIFFHYLSSDKRVLPNTLNNNSVCVCVCVQMQESSWEVFFFADLNTE